MNDPLTYGSSLWSPTSLRAVEGQADESRAFLKRLITFAKDKNDLDHNYSKQLRKLVEKLGIPDQQNEQRTFDIFMNAFKNLNLNIANSFDQAAAQADEQVVKPLAQYQEQHKKTTKQLEDEIKQAQKNLATYQEALESAKQACKRACDELQRAKENPQPVESTPEPVEQLSAESSSSSQPEKKNRFGGLFKRDGGNKLFSAMSDKMHGAMASVNVQSIQSIGQKTDINSLTERALAADAKYISSVKAIREYRPQYDQHLTHLLDSSQAAEEEMRSSSTDLLATYLTLQTALFTSNVENMHTVGAVLGKVKVPSDSQVFIRQNRSLGNLPALPVYEMQRGHPQYIEGVNQSGEDDHARSGSSDVDNHLVRRTTKKDIEEERNYQRIMNEQVLTLFVDKVTGYATDKASTSSDHTGKHVVEAKPLDEEETRVAARLFQTAEGRSAFATVVNLQRNRGQLHLSQVAFDSFASLVMLFLDHAREAMHVTPIQLVMILSQSLFRDPTDEEKDTLKRDKIFLSTVVKSHPVWVDERFWNESFYDAFKSKISPDQIAVHKWHSDSEQRESLHARKQAAFATLSTFAMNMAEFGMTKAQINHFVEKQAHLNDLDQDQIEMLRMMDQMHSRRASIDEGESIGAFRRASEQLEQETAEHNVSVTSSSDDAQTESADPHVDPFADEANDSAQAAISALQSVDSLWASAREL